MLYVEFYTIAKDRLTYQLFIGDGCASENVPDLLQLLFHVLKGPGVGACHTCHPHSLCLLHLLIYWVTSKLPKHL